MWFHCRIDSNLQEFSSLPHAVLIFLTNSVLPSDLSCMCALCDNCVVAAYHRQHVISFLPIVTQISKYAPNIYMASFKVYWHFTSTSGYVHLNYQFFHQNESCSLKSGLVKIIIWIDKLWKIFWGCAPYAQSWVFFAIFQNTASLLPLYLSL